MLAASNLKRSNEYAFAEEIDMSRHQQSVESMRDQISASAEEGEKRQQFVQKLADKYEEMLRNDLNQCESEFSKVNNYDEELKKYADDLIRRSQSTQSKLTKEENEIEDINKKIDALSDETKRMKGEEVNLKEAKNQLTDSRNKDLKSCCDKKKNFDKVKKLVDGKFANNQNVKGIMDGIFQFCFGPDANYSSKARIMQTIDDFNTGVRGATCNLNKDFVKNLMEGKIKGGEEAESQGEYYKELIKDQDKDMIFIIPFFKLLSRMCHLQMHMFKFYKNERKQAVNVKKIEDLRVKIETAEAVIEALQVTKQMADEAHAMNDFEIKAIHTKVQRLGKKISETKQKQTEFKEKFFEDLQ